MLALEKGTARGEHKPATVFRTGDNDFVCINFYISHLVSSDRVVMRPSLKVHGYRDAFPCIITALTVVVSDAFLWDGSCRTSVYRQWVFAMPHLALPFIGAHWWEHNSNSNFFFRVLLWFGWTIFCNTVNIADTRREQQQARWEHMMDH